MIVTLQQADPKIADPDLRWLTDLERVALQRTAGPDGTTWAEYMAVEHAAAPQRLVIEESEPALFGGDDPDLVGNVIYTEVVELPASARSTRRRSPGSAPHSIGR